MVLFYQNEDQHITCYPLHNQQDRALFVVADGHGGKDAAIAAVELFPLVVKELMEKSREGDLPMDVLFAEVEKRLKSGDSEVTETGWVQERFDCEGM
jgi:serine/threonine protein phosphatase PrpC